MQKPESDRTEALICTQKLQSQRFLQENLKEEGKEALIDTNYYLVTIIKTLQINKPQDQNQKRKKQVDKVVNKSNRKTKQEAKI